LIFIKRLLPRWVNGIPDSEIITLYQTCKKISGKPIIIETGCGASTIAFVLYAILKNGKVYSWDTNGSKGFFLNSVMNESLGKTFGININDYWNFIASSSTETYSGINLIKEKRIKPNFAFFDSDHTWKTVGEELKLFLKISKKDSIIAFDDAYYNYKEHNIPYINMIRSKLDLKPIKNFKANISKPFFDEAKNFIKKNNYKSTEIKTNFKSLILNDLFLKYYSGDRQFMNKLGMEEKNKITQRIRILKVTKK